MNAKQARDITERFLGAVDNQKTFEELSTAIDLVIKKRAEEGKWDATLSLSRYRINEEIIDLLLKHYQLNKFDVEFFHTTHKREDAIEIYEFNVISIYLGWQRQIHEVSDGKQREETSTPDGGRSPEPPLTTGGTPAVLKVDEVETDTDIPAALVEEPSRAAAAA